MDKIGIFGTGVVGRTIGTKMAELGYEVMMGSRTANNPKARDWGMNYDKSSNGTFEDVAKWADIIFNCTKGEITLDVFRLAGVENLNGKVIIDISNSLDSSRGTPVPLIEKYANTNSLGEEIQRLVPDAKIVKSLNMVNCEVMINAQRCGGEATMFMSGNDAEAKEKVRSILQQFGWVDIIDLGDIVGARGMEMILPLWLRTSGTTKDYHFAFKIVRP